MREMNTSSREGGIGRADKTSRPWARRSLSIRRAPRGGAGGVEARQGDVHAFAEGLDVAHSTFRGDQFQGPAFGMSEDLHHRAVRLGAQRVGCRHREHARAVHQGHALAALGLVEIRRGHEESEAFALQAGQDLPEVAPRHGIDARGRLVEDEQLGGVDQSAGEGQLLLHAARQAIGQPVAEGSHAQHVEQFFAASLRVAHAVDVGEEGHVLVDGQVAVERKALRQIADALREFVGLLPRIETAGADASSVGGEAVRGSRARWWSCPRRQVR
jgi:hypothetical protein